jgi:hypothetical protein
MLSGTGFSRGHKGSGVSASAVVTRHCTPPASLAIISRPAKSARELSTRTCGRLYSGNTLLVRLVEDLQDMTFEPWPLVEAQEAVVHP